MGYGGQIGQLGQGGQGGSGAPWMTPPSGGMSPSVWASFFQNLQQGQPTMSPMAMIPQAQQGQQPQSQMPQMPQMLQQQQGEWSPILGSQPTAPTGNAQVGQAGPAAGQGNVNPTMTPSYNPFSASGNHQHGPNQES